MKTPILALAAASLLAGAAVAQTGSTSTPPSGPVVVQEGTPQTRPNIIWAAPPATETGQAVSGATTMQDLQTKSPSTKDYPLCTRTRKDSCRNPGSR